MLKLASDLKSKKISKATRGKLFYFFLEKKSAQIYIRLFLKDVK